MQRFLHVIIQLLGATLLPLIYLLMHGNAVFFHKYSSPSIGNFWCIQISIHFLVSGIVGRISPKTWDAMEVFLASIATEEYESMASALIQMGATNRDVDANAFAKDLEKMFSSIQASNFSLYGLSL